jgi:nitroreductase
MAPPRRRRSSDTGKIAAFTAQPIGRRRFLIVTGGMAAAAAIGPRLAWAKKAAQLGPAPGVLQPWTLPDDPPEDNLELARALIGAAVLAPSEWNTQPWRFEVERASVRMVADPARLLPWSDPNSRGVTISLGAALENLLIAARAYGLRPTVDYLPHAGANGVVAEVIWASGDVRRDRALFAAIPGRRTNRREYDGRGIFPEQRAQLAAQVPEGLSLHWMDDRPAIRSVAKLAHEAVRDQCEDARIAAEQFSWMRFGDEARRRGDGVPVDNLELGVVASWMAKRYFNPTSWYSRFGPENAAREARDGLRSAGALVLLCALKRDQVQWLMGGQAWERIALQASALGLAVQPVSAPIQVERHRALLLKSFEATGEEPLMLARLGHAKNPPATTRRNVALVSTFRTS